MSDKYLTMFNTLIYRTYYPISMLKEHPKMTNFKAIVAKGNNIRFITTTYLPADCRKERDIQCIMIKLWITFIIVQKQ